MLNRLAICFAALIFSIASATFAHAGDTIRVGVDQNKPSVFWGDDGKVQGFYVDVFEYAAAQEQWQVEYVKGTWSQLMEWVESGEIDLVVGMAYTEERDKIYDFTEETVFSNWGQLYTKDKEIDTVLDLRGKTLSGMKDDIYTNSFQAILKKFDVDVTLKAADAYAGALECVDKGTADAAIVSRVGGLELEGEYDLYRSSVICCPKEIRYATLEGKNKHLLTGLSKHMRVLKSDNDSLYFQSLDKWYSVTSQEKIPTWLVWSLYIVCGFLVLAGGVNIVLQKQVAARTADLRAEITEREKTEAELNIARADLEAKVGERTIELRKALDLVLLEIEEKTSIASELRGKNSELNTAMEEIKTLRGIIPICASCKNIRDDKGSWSQVEAYVSTHTDAEFSHGICPTCAKELYPEVFDKDSKA